MATKVKQDGAPRKLIGPHSARRTQFARARISTGLTFRALQKRGYSPATISAAEKGDLPKHPAIRAALLSEVGLAEVDGRLVEKAL